MSTRIYLALLVVRLFLALQPSYIHPDENFQGPEVVAGRIFAFPHHLTWEFTTENPIRSVFPLWPIYGLPMLVLRWIWSGVGISEVPPRVVYYTMRGLMFILSLVLEDWAIHELVQSPQHRRLAITLVASSYVTWTYQTHTLSNSVETLVVAWSLVMILRVLDNKQRASLLSSTILGGLIAFGIFNRVTFPAYLLVPCLYLLPHFFRRPSSLLVFFISVLLTTSFAIVIDTDFYNPDGPLIHTLLTNPTFTPLNSLLYNTQTSNLATHGLHPHYQHLAASLPLLLGPALYLFFSAPNRNIPRLPMLSAISGTLLLSCIPHQEPRFLLPAIPLFLSSLHLPRSRLSTRYWLAAWIVFNALFGVLMGIYHQGGVIPAQTWLGQQSTFGVSTTEVLWWRTYSPPIWLLDHNLIRTTNLMGIPFASLQMQIETTLGPECNTNKTVGLVAPYSSLEIDPWIAKSVGNQEFNLEEVWRYDKHLNLDDLDLEREGIWGTLERVVGRRGLVVWKIRRVCRVLAGEGAAGVLGVDW